jgi:site-specific DNA-methyltransferase (adenine-specific)/modification methylase
MSDDFPADPLATEEGIQAYLMAATDVSGVGGGEAMSDYLILNADCRRMPVDLARVDAVVTDPPYGIGYRREAGGRGLMHRDRPLRIRGDDRPFDPRRWLDLPCLFWGAHHFAERLPRGSWLAWDKAPNCGPDDNFADCDFAWCSMPGIKRNIFRYSWKGMACAKIDENNGRGQVIRLHPTQKPIALMRWCVRLLGLPPGSTILDPYMGSGSTLIAALAEGHRAIGIEIDPRYCAIARRRIERPHAPVPRPGRAEELPLFANEEGT